MKFSFFHLMPYPYLPDDFDTAYDSTALTYPNANFDPALGSALYNRYLDEKIYAEEMGFDMLMLNEHHSTPFCMGGVMNVEASILARETKRAKIVLLGNVIPIWEDPLWLAETLATIDMISRGRLVSGWVRGTGRESVAHNSQAPYNWERFQEAHDFIVKAWTDPGPFRWEGEHYNYRYVNPWMRPYQTPRPQIWIPGVFSRNTVKWTAEHRYPYVMLATQLEPTKASYRVREGDEIRVWLPDLGDGGEQFTGGRIMGFEFLARRRIDPFTVDQHLLVGPIRIRMPGHRNCL